MQKRTQQASKSASEPPTFPTHTKNIALKILDDYSLRSGRKWQYICSEILRTVEADATQAAPLLTRQDLESWSARRSILGDTKFRLIYKFLTHPDTLARPEFFKARDLIDMGRTERFGEIFESFFTEYPESGYLRRTLAGKNVEADVIEDRFNGFAGCYTGGKDSRNFCLSLTPFPNKKFFICHFFSWPAMGAGSSSDWNIQRFSGFATIGNLIRLHTKGIVIPIAREMFLTPKADPASNQIDVVHLLMYSMIDQAIQNIFQDDLKHSYRRMKFVNPHDHVLVLRRSEDSTLKKFVDQFQWNVPI